MVVVGGRGDGRKSYYSMDVEFQFYKDEKSYGDRWWWWLHNNMHEYI